MTVTNSTLKEIVLLRKVCLSTIYEFKKDGYYFTRSLNDIVTFIATPYKKVVSVYTRGLKRLLKAVKTSTLTI
jgi:hypothetical protein